MTIAENKKKSNISEYIIYMYQTEDLIRVYDFDIALIRQYVIKHIPVSEEEKESIAQWYVQLMETMREEGIVGKGHLQMVQAYVQELTDLKTQLIHGDENFKVIYNKTKPHINQSLKLADGKITNEVQVCLNGIYGLLLARMNGRQVPEDIMPGIDAFGDLLSYLSYKYKSDKHEE